MIHLLFALMLCAGCSGEPVVPSARAAALRAPCVDTDESAETAISLCGAASRNGQQMEACHRAIFAPGARISVRTCGTTQTLVAGTWSAELRIQ